jgi:hypothetical protein
MTPILVNIIPRCQSILICNPNRVCKNPSIFLVKSCTEDIYYCGIHIKRLTCSRGIDIYKLRKKDRSVSTYKGKTKILSIHYLQIVKTLRVFITKCRSKSADLLGNMKSVFKRIKRSNSTSKCVICLDNIMFILGNKKPLSCGHVFHKRCIDEWFTRKRRCPLCRKQN